MRVWLDVLGEREDVSEEKRRAEAGADLGALSFAEFNAFDDTPWVLRLVDYVKDVLAQRRVRLVGVCFGHQIIGRAMGAPVGRSEGGAWEVSVCDVQLTAEGTKVFGGRESLVRKGSCFIFLLSSPPFYERWLERLRR